MSGKILRTNFLSTTLDTSTWPYLIPHSVLRKLSSDHFKGTWPNSLPSKVVSELHVFYVAKWQKKILNFFSGGGAMRGELILLFWFSM